MPSRSEPSPCPTLAVRLVRAWTHLYTRPLPPALRAGRRAEIESDLWESRHEADASGQARGADLQMLLRLLRGMPNDLRWCAEAAGRAEDGRLARRRRGVGALALAATMALLLGTFWMLPILRPAALPAPRPNAWIPAPPPLPCLPGDLPAAGDGRLTPAAASPAARARS